HPFISDHLLRELERETKAMVLQNMALRRYTQDEFIAVLKEYKPTVLLAGTERYSSKELDLAPQLEMIARVGSGLDSVDLKECKNRGIHVTNTPDAPTNAVAELTIAQMLNALRGVRPMSTLLKRGMWSRYVGRDLTDCIVGGCRATDRDTLIEKCDIISIHVNSQGNPLIHYSDMQKMKKDVVLLNMSRGGLIDESHLLRWLSENEESVAAIDAFMEEPYSGPLTELNNALLTPHAGGCTKSCKQKMEFEAVDSIRKFLESKK
ncbi:MAG: NAD(P)-dependent oxidoreductase, partial [Candidatus Thorarchaeota archaeon]